MLFVANRKKKFRGAKSDRLLAAVLRTLDAFALFLHHAFAQLAAPAQHKDRHTVQRQAQTPAQQVPPLLLQPLVENSIKHGLEPKVEGGSVRVSARREGSAVVLEVIDTGVGFATEPEAGKGFGLTQVRERLKTTYGSQAAISFVANSAGGTSASITFPLVKEK